MSVYCTLHVIEMSTLIKTVITLDRRTLGGQIRGTKTLILSRNIVSLQVLGWCFVFFTLCDQLVVQLMLCDKLRVFVSRNTAPLSPGQMVSQVDASWNLGQLETQIGQGLRGLAWLALTLVEIKCAHKSAQVFPCGHPTQVGQRKLSALTYYWLMKQRVVCLNFFCGWCVLARKLASPFNLV